MRKLLMVVGCVAIGCAPREAAEEQAAPVEPQVLTVEATDFAFTMPDTVRPGITRVRMRTGGTQLHHVQLIRLADGHTLEELMGLMAASHEAPIPDWAVLIGGPNAVVPGDSSEVILDLAPGTHAAICVIPTDGRPHVAMGMFRSFVVAGEPTGAVASEPSITMHLVDYAFNTSVQLTSGTHTIRVVNDAAQPHEVVFVQLAPGASGMDLVNWFQRGDSTPPPGRPIGGTVGIAQGLHNDLTVTLAPGRYALICFLPDAGDGRWHAMHGMVSDIEVI